MLRRGRISLEQAQEALSAYREIPLRFLEVDLEEALTLSDSLGIYAYDAYVIAVAQKQRCPLLTLDGALLAAARRIGLEVLEIAS